MTSEAQGQGQKGAGEVVKNMAHEKPLHGDGAGTIGTGTGTAASSFEHLSLSARTVHADDYLNSHPAVAPPMHVSTTFRYNRDPDRLEPWLNINVRLL